MKKFIVPLFVILFALSCTQETDIKSPPLEEGYPSATGMSSDRLARIDSMLAESVAQGKIPGAVALVARKGKIVFYKAFGMADNAAGRKMEKDAIFRIASQSKAITATAVMMLWEEGRFRLDDPISKYIPEFKNPQVLKDFNPEDSSYTTVPAASEITIRELLTHTSGIGYGMIDGDERFRKIYQKAGIIDGFTTADVTVAENIKTLGEMPLHHNPGEKFTYSEGLDVLGYLIEIVSGMPFDQFLRKRLFEPLGMNDTWFYLPEEKASRLVTVQRPEDGKWVKYPKTFYDTDYPVTGAKKYFAGGAGLSSTAKDYATFLQMYLNRGELNGKRILSPTTVRTIMGNQNYKVWDSDTESYYGLAFSVTTKRGEEKGGNGSEGTFRWGGYFNTSYFADPKEEIIGILMKQTQDAANDDTEWRFSILVGQAIND